MKQNEYQKGCSFDPPYPVGSTLSLWNELYNTVIIRNPEWTNWGNIWNTENPTLSMCSFTTNTSLRSDSITSYTGYYKFSLSLKVRDQVVPATTESRTSTRSSSLDREVFGYSYTCVSETFSFISSNLSHQYPKDLSFVFLNSLPTFLVW